MNQKQRALFTQLQLAGLGIVLFVFAIYFQRWAIAAAGAFLFVYGLLRFFLLRRLLNPAEKNEENEDNS